MAGDTLMLLHECGKGRPVPGILNDGVAVTPDGYFFAWADPELVNPTPRNPHTRAEWNRREERLQCIRHHL